MQNAMANVGKVKEIAITMMIAWMVLDVNTMIIGLDGEWIIAPTRNVTASVPVAQASVERARVIAILTRIVFQDLNASMIGLGISSPKRITALKSLGIENVINFLVGCKKLTA